VVGKDYFQCFAAQFQQFPAGGVDLHSLFAGSGAGAQRLSVDLDHANSAVAKSGQVFMVAKVGYLVSGFGAGMQYLGVFGHLGWLAVNIYSYHLFSSGVLNIIVSALWRRGGIVSRIVM